ncbi:MAG: N-acetyl-gamma-glutamyl-phosphate reductase [Desulfobacterales bacterium]|nr:N-acetyl-gamma-glutamyl-phosphate reductase [Desulfobacterales bacterium]MDD4071154.1 N-acetyl-gamma-glutamyl-phosphate reductase [Desulfobacterales bacterium]MDD4392590.1 N-acetyl-gamma-glutamyl-phosphate reductase [Desulfobacterales bacterium]
MTRVAVVGATGYAGAELVRILAGHDDVKLTVLTSRQYAGVRFDHVYPAMNGIVELECENFSVDRISEMADVVFMALPHKIPMQTVPELIDRGKKVVDLSADFRFRDVAVYETYYQPHTAAKLLETSVYGLCEVYGDQIRTARLIGNPGCYPTSMLLPLIPLIKHEIIDHRTIVVDSKSGVSGAGRSLSLGSHYCQANESFKAYKVCQHRHTPEMEEVLSHEAGESVHITFVPHLVPMTRGMLSTIYATLTKPVSSDDIRNCLSSFYSGRSFVRICPEGSFPDTLHVRGTNYCDIGFKIDQRTHRIVIVSVIDNLVKGAAGQAVQNMNIMLGFDETRGLNTVPYPL